MDTDPTHVDPINSKFSQLLNFQQLHSYKLQSSKLELINIPIQILNNTMISMERVTSLLYNAAVEGSVTDLLELLQQGRLILDRLTALNGITETPLHVAALLGHTAFAKEVLNRKPQLAKEMDSQRSSPLHLAYAKGYVEIVKLLLVVSPDMCFVGDKDGLNPLQLAAIKGRVDVLRELVGVAPEAARATTADRGDTIMHWCVKYNQLEAMRLLAEMMHDDYEFVNAKDYYGMNILHLAVTDKHIEVYTFIFLLL